MRDRGTVPPTMTSDLSPEVREIQQAIDLSFQVEAFLKSPIGKHLIKRSDDDVETAVEALKRVDPEDVKAVRALQNTISVAESIQYWLAEAIQSGHNAAEQFMKDQ